MWLLQQLLPLAAMADCTTGLLGQFRRTSNTPHITTPHSIMMPATSLQHVSVLRTALQGFAGSAADQLSPVRRT
jgi:hypothetical protein